MAIPVQINHTQEGINRLLEQFKDKPVIKAILENYLLSIDELEDTYFSLLNERNVFDAVGAQLDLIGAIVVEPREGRNDTEYRTAILLKIGLNNSEGTPNTIMDILQEVSGASKVNIWEHYPASAIYYANVPEAEDISGKIPFIYNSEEVVGTGLAEITNTYTPQNTSGKDYVESLQRYSPAATGETTIIFDPDENTFVGSELELETGLIIDEAGNFLVDENGDNIYYEQWVIGNNVNDRNVFPELPQASMTGLDLKSSVYTTQTYTVDPYGGFEHFGFIFGNKAYLNRGFVQQFSITGDNISTATFDNTEILVGDYDAGDLFHIENGLAYFFYYPDPSPMGEPLVVLGTYNLDGNDISNSTDTGNTIDIGNLLGLNPANNDAVYFISGDVVGDKLYLNLNTLEGSHEQAGIYQFSLDKNNISNTTYDNKKFIYYDSITPTGLDWSGELAILETNNLIAVRETNVDDHPVLGQYSFDEDDISTLIDDNNTYAVEEITVMPDPPFPAYPQGRRTIYVKGNNMYVHDEANYYQYTLTFV